MIEKKSNIIIFSTADWDEPYWTNKQHTAKSLSHLGHNIIYIESVGLRKPKMGSAKDFNRIKNRIKTGIKTLICGARKVDKNICVLAPLIIPAAHKSKLISYFNNAILSWLINRETKKISCDELIVWTYHPYILTVIKKIEYSKLLYHCVDDLSVIPGVDKKLFKEEENKLLILSDKVFATNEALNSRCLKYNNSSEYLPNVVDFEHFNQASAEGHILRELLSIPKPRIIYHGVLSDFKVDFELLVHLATERPNYSLVIAGEEREGQSNEVFARLKSLKNVYHLGYMEYNILPDLLRGMDVALLPTLINDYTHSMFPMKYYEYTAATLPIVSTNLSFLSSITNEHLSIGKDFHEYVLMVDKQIQSGKLTSENALAYVGENTWKARTKKMIKSLDSYE
jgi:hypothetical protein